MGILPTDGGKTMNEKYADVYEALRRHGVKCACVMFENGDVIDIDCLARCHDEA